MIAKISPIRKAAASQYSRLAKYIAEPKPGVSERVEAVWIENTEEENDWEVASWKIEARQTANERTEKSKSYHVIVSFRPEEAAKLTLDDHKVIATRFTKALGLENHERICALHGDTKNKHLHLAISLIDPEGRIKEPFNAFHTLKQTRLEIGKDYGFQPAEKNQGKGVSDANARREAHGNESSFEGWLKEYVSKDVASFLETDKTTWNQLHTMLSRHGVSIKKRGAGLVVSHDTEKLFVKASSVHRGLSLKKLEDKLGAFEKSEKKPREPKGNSYQGGSTASKELYARYRKELEVRQKRREAQRVDTNAANAKAKAGISASIKAAKSKVLETESDLKLRRAKLKQLTFLRAQQMETQAAIHKPRMDEIKAANAHETWHQYLTRKAKEGDSAAIVALQRRGAEVLSQGENEISGKDEWGSVGTTYRDLSCVVSANGRVTYRTKEKKEILDYGRRLVVGANLDEKTITATLQLAVAKYGNKLELRGSQPFKEAVRKYAKKITPEISFTEKDLNLAGKLR